MSQSAHFIAKSAMEYEGKTIIHVHAPPSAEVHSYKKIIYDRVDDADVKVTSTSQIAAMYIRKQNIFTEKRIYPYVTMENLRISLVPVLEICLSIASTILERNLNLWKGMCSELLCP